MTIGIINYKAGNAKSVQNALNRLGVHSKYIDTSLDFSDVTHIILPGVGSASATLQSLEESNLIEPLETAVIKHQQPFLGICIGQQILFEHSEEGDQRGLGWLKGHVKKYDDRFIKVPQIGWNKVTFQQPEHPLVQGLVNDYFYFVNAYYVVPTDTSITFGLATYGQPFCASVQHENIFATQFHVEKSGEAGLKILENFSKWSIQRI